MNSNGCVDTAHTKVIVNPVLIAPVITPNDTALCEGEILQLATANVADTYAWTGPNGYTANTATPATIVASTITAGTYGLNVTINGCVSHVDSIIVVVNPTPVTPVLTATNVICDGDSIVLSTTAVAENYYWIAPNGDSITNKFDTLRLTSASAYYGNGNWRLVTENISGCFSANSNIESITINPIPVALASNNGSICANDDAILTGNTILGGTYQWYDSNYVALLSTDAIHTELSLVPGLYTYHFIMNSNGCLDSAETVVTVNPVLSAPVITPNDTTLCESELFSLSTTNVADSYAWTGPNG